ncbi:Hypothetical protein PHPALM_14191 [Phytophthora palmivora]|uniref:Uncharacterized protein n=1 Tax=Phytophthora palmivora TaxID=4796 RepID=A0A2P4XVE8_9STRA|nr:Hypothetical protein PHPALM_14191 [Phytophthora palmivora]
MERLKTRFMGKRYLKYAEERVKLSLGRPVDEYVKPALLIGSLPREYDQVVQTFLVSHKPQHLDDSPNYEQIELALEMVSTIVKVVKQKVLRVPKMKKRHTLLVEDAAEDVVVAVAVVVVAAVMEDRFAVLVADLVLVVAGIKRPPAEDRSGPKGLKQVKLSGGKNATTEKGNYANESDDSAYVILQVMKMKKAIADKAHDNWYLASGASSHISNQLTDFVEFTPLSARIGVGGKNSLSVEGTGTVVKDIETSGGRPIKAVTNEDVLTAIETRCRTLKNNFVPDVTSRFRQNLKMDLSTDDCDARVFHNHQYFSHIVENNGLQGPTGSEDEDSGENGDGYKSRMKARCRLLVHNLQPPVLKAKITRLIDLERRDFKIDDVALFELILEHAKFQLRFHRLSKAYAGKNDGSKAKTTTSLLAIQSSIEMRHLAGPVDAVLSNGSVRICLDEVTLDLDLVTVTGPVYLREVPCLVMDGDGGEVLLGKDALKHLGIDVEQSLALLAGSTLLIDAEDEFSVGGESPDPGQPPVLIMAIDELLERAVKNSLPSGHVDAVGNLLEIFLSRLDALTSFPVPATVADLHWLIFASNWLYESLPDYARVVTHLHAKLETDKKRIGKRNQNALMVATHWTGSERAAYNAVSLTGYSFGITQVKRWLPGVAVDKQHHELIISDDRFVFPTLYRFRTAQPQTTQIASRFKEEDGVLTITRRPWIPNAAKDLLARIFIVAHCGSQGHRGQDGMISTIDGRFYISQLADKVAKFMRECLLCKHVKGLDFFLVLMDHY